MNCVSGRDFGIRHLSMARDVRNKGDGGGDDVASGIVWPRMTTIVMAMEKERERRNGNGEMRQWWWCWWAVA